MGSGSGYFTIPLARIFNKVYAVDLSKEMLDYVNYPKLSQGASCFNDRTRSPSIRSAGFFRRDCFRRPRPEDGLRRS
ncbi:MAG: methyltransferase domain-containing protein [Candidatus Odinarchaeia archaeon]